MSAKSSYRFDPEMPGVDGVFAVDKPNVEYPQRRTLTRPSFRKGKFRLFGHYVHGQFIFLALTEFVILMCANTILYANLTSAEATDQYSWLSEAVLVGGIFSLTLFSGMAAVGLYDTRQRERFAGISLRIGMVFLFVFSATSVLLIYVGLMPANGNYGLAMALSSMFCLALTRIVFYRYLDGKTLRRRILVLGVGEKASYINRLRRKSDRRGFELAGYVAKKGCEQIQVDLENIVLIDDSICRYASDNGIDEIVVALDNEKEDLPEQELLNCRMSGIQVTPIADFFERERTILHVELVQPDGLIFGGGFNRGFVASMIKRTLDVLVSILLLIATFPVIVVTAILIWLESRGKGSVLYKQERVGRGGNVFSVYKFRSMVTNAENDGKAQWAQKHDSRITRVGRVIRNYRIDELPQLWNVLKGNMSLVGPRPERPQFVEQLSGINSLYSYRHHVDPGITGWAQLCYPYGSSEKDSIQKLQYDLYYVKNRGLFLDLYILAQTVEAVLFKKGAR